MEDSIFTGSVLGLIGINLLTLIITIFTLGIGYPWALVIKERWVISNTKLNGYSLYFDGSGMQLIGNWIKWLILIIITLGIYGFWVELKVHQWKTKHIHIVNIS